MDLQLRNTNGRKAGRLKVRDDVFAAPMNPALVRQVIVGQLANARQGTVSTKTRANVSGGGRKPRAQKHTGMARQGTIRAPHWRGGGVVFGPHPRSFRHRTPKRMRRMSLVATLSDKVREGELIVLKSLELDSPKTAELRKVLDSVGAGPSTLLVADGAEPTVLRAARNIPRVKTLPSALLNTLDLTKYRSVVMTVSAVRRAEELWGGDSARSGNRSKPASQGD